VLATQATRLYERHNATLCYTAMAAHSNFEVHWGNEGGVDSDGSNRGLSDVAYEKLLDRLLSGEIVAGAVLHERGIAELLNISRTPIREALSRLEAEGLVERGVGRRMIVRKISIQSYIEILKVRRLLEAEAAAEAAGRIEAGKAAEIRTAIRTLMETENPTPTHHWAVDDLVHSTIAEASENRLLASLIRDLRRRTHIFNTRRIPSRLKPGGMEHLAIIDAVADGDSAKASALMTAHIDNARQAILDQLLTLRRVR
jgi:DNA-binding GntR family transcriptional regulator